MVLNPHVWWFRWGFTIILSIISIFNGFFIPQYVLMQTVKPSLQLLNPFMSKDGSIMFNPDRFNSDFILIQHWIGGRANHVWWLNDVKSLFSSVWISTVDGQTQFYFRWWNPHFRSPRPTGGSPEVPVGGPNVGSTGRYVKNGANLNVRQFTQIVNMN